MTDEELSNVRSLQGIDELFVPVIRVRDKTDGRVHIVGSSSHDQLIIDGRGYIYYRNMQNNETTQPGGDYEFVVADPQKGYIYDNACKWYSPERFKRLSDWYKKRMKKMHDKYDSVLYKILFKNK